MALRAPVHAAATAALVRSWRFRVWMAVSVLLGLGLTAVPLFGVLGYELALATAIVGSLAGLDLGAALARRAVAVPDTGAAGPGRSVASLVGRAAGVAVAVVVPPAIIAALDGLRLPTCDWGFGLRAYLLMPVASAALGGGAGALVGLVTGPRRVVGNLAPPLLWLGLFAAALARFYGAPPVFSYTPLVGYFPGNLYDEQIVLGSALIWSRLEQAAAIAAVAAVAAAFLDVPALRLRLRGRRPDAPRWQAWLAAAVLAAIAGGLRVEGGALGYAITADDIQAELGGRRETPHFVIHYARRPDIERDIDLIATDHEFRYAQVVDALGGAAVDAATKIHSYYFADSDQKARWMGARQVEMAKPWRREIYLTHQGFPHRSLRHEIAHVVAGRFGDPWFSVSARRVLGLPVLVNPGLIEGLAVAVDWPAGYDRSLTPHQSVRAMQELGVEPDLGDVFSLRFLSLASARGYTAAGSFMRFLLDSRGAEALRRLYATGGDFRAAYGESQDRLVAAWRQVIDGIELPAGAAEVVRERFRRGGVFTRSCPHAIAERRDRAYRLADDGERGEAVQLLRQVCRDAPDEPRHRLELADMLAEGSPADRAEAEAIWRQVVDDPAVTTSLRADAIQRLGRRAAATGNLAAAGALFDQGAALPVDDDERRMHEAQGFAVHHAGPAGAVLRGYFFAGGDGLAWAGAAVGLEPGLGLTWYLRGLQRLDHGDPAGAAADLAEALRRPLPSPRFVRAAARRMAAAAWRAGLHDQVEAAAAVLSAAEQPEVEHLLAADWRQRIRFATTGAIK